MVDALPYLMLGLNSKILGGTKMGREISKVFETFDKFINDLVKRNHQFNNNNLENTAIDILLDPKNDFDDTDVKEELILMLLGVSLRIQPQNF